MLASEKYRFYDRLTAPFPSQVIVDATEVCNLACIHCPHPEFKKSSIYKAEHFSPEINNKLVEELRTHGRGVTQYLRYTGMGEPMANPLIFEMLDHAARNSGVFVCLTSNGTVMTEKRIDALLRADIHMIDISIDAFSKETYSVIRVRGNLDVTRANVLRLLERKRETGSAMKVVVSYVEQPQNVHETDQFEAYWKEQGADFVVVRKLHSAAGHQSSAVVELTKKKAGIPRRACLYPWERITVTAGGYLAFCPQDWNHGSIFADYRETSIKDVWQGEFYRKLREAHLSNDYSCHGFCGNCPDWQLTSWPGEGRSYANMVEEFVQPSQAGG